MILKTSINKSNGYRPAGALAIGIFTGLTSAHSAFTQNARPLLPQFQVTNSIPTNLFLTDDNQVFWYKPGQRFVAVGKIEEARHSRESRPAAQDPEGNWGEATNGFQMSIRFANTNYSVGEPLTAVVLIRNVAQKSETYNRPVRIIAAKNGSVLKRKNDTGPFVITMPPQTSLFPQTQHRYGIEINKDYDLSENGKYTFQAECEQPEVTSKKVTVLITAAPQKQ